LAGLVRRDAVPTDCWAVLLDIADPVAVNIVTSAASTLGFVTQLTAISPLSIANRFAAVVDVAVLKGEYFV
jgi:hypothetical protein